ncbi:MAG: helix-turn-helix transcriptional regulator [Gaiellaceae bacterium]
MVGHSDRLPRPRPGVHPENWGLSPDPKIRPRQLQAIRVRRLREQAGKTQRQLADEVGLTEKQVQKIESSADGRTRGRDIKIEERGRFAKALGVPGKELFSDLGSADEHIAMSGMGSAGAAGSGTAEVIRGDSGA